MHTDRNIRARHTIIWITIKYITYVDTYTRTHNGNACVYVLRIKVRAIPLTVYYLYLSPSAYNQPCTDMATFDGAPQPNRKLKEKRENKRQEHTHKHTQSIHVCVCVAAIRYDTQNTQVYTTRASTIFNEKKLKIKGHWRKPWRTKKRNEISVNSISNKYTKIKDCKVKQAGKNEKLCTSTLRQK